MHQGIEMDRIDKGVIPVPLRQDADGLAQTLHALPEVFPPMPGDKDIGRPGTDDAFGLFG